MASKIKVDQIEGSTASTITLPSGQTLDLSSGSLTLPDGAVDLSTAKVTGTLASGNLPTISVSKGGTGLTSLGTAGQALKVNSGATALEFGAISAGKVLQFVSSFKTDTFSVSTTTFTNTGLSASITPSSTSNKIFIICFGGSASASNGGTRAHMRINGTTTQFVGDSATGFEASATVCTRSANDGWQQIPFTISGIDAPNSTSEQTYTLQMCSESGSTAYLNRPANTPDNNSGNTMSSIVLMELEG